MSARDVIASVAENKQFQIGEQKADAILAALDAAGYAVVKTWPNQEMCSVLYKSRSEQIQPFEGVDCWASHVIKRLVEAAKETT